MRKFLLALAILLSLSICVFAQKSDPKKTISAVAASADTLQIPSATKFIKLDGIGVVNVADLSALIKSSYVSANDEYWYQIYLFFKGSKNPAFSSGDQDKIMSAFMPFVERYIKAAQEEQKKQEQSKKQ